jgi:uncharacterized pyridoxamine 5'-phosphate oxidase family protein
MNKVVKFLTENPVQYLATVGRDGKAKCRPFMFCFEQDGKPPLSRGLKHTRSNCSTPSCRE